MTTSFRPWLSLSQAGPSAELRNGLWQDAEKVPASGPEGSNGAWPAGAELPRDPVASGRHGHREPAEARQIGVRTRLSAERAGN